MQSCDYCGRKSEESVHYCIECGTSLVDEVRDSEALSLSAALRGDMAAAGLARRYEVRLKRVMYVIAGVCWILFALAIVLFLAAYVAEGAGLPFLALGVSSLTVLIGLVHVVGMAFATALSLGLGLTLLALGVVSE